MANCKSAITDAPTNGDNLTYNQPVKKRRLSSGKEIIVIPVLADEYLKNPVLEKVIVAEILEKKHISRLIKVIQDRFPFKSRHLKRVNSKGSELQVIICPLSEIQFTELSNSESFLVKELFDNAALDLGGLSSIASVVEVPRDPPLTRQQFEFGLKIWPQQFHEDKRISKALDGTLFNEEELTKHEKFMKMAVELAKTAAAEGNVAIGAVIVNNSEAIVGSGHDRRHTHPLQHAAMVAIDSVAFSQGGGAWNLTDSFKGDAKSSTVDPDGPYLCTGYTAYLTREPCIMCAMALLHSRIKCVFYAIHSDQGALGTLYKLHVQPSLNHHFEVFKLLCDSLDLSIESS